MNFEKGEFVNVVSAEILEKFLNKKIHYFAKIKDIIEPHREFFPGIYKLEFSFYPPSIVDFNYYRNIFSGNEISHWEMRTGSNVSDKIMFGKNYPIEALKLGNLIKDVKNNIKYFIIKTIQKKEKDKFVPNTTIVSLSCGEISEEEYYNKKFIKIL